MHEKNLHHDLILSMKEERKRLNLSYQRLSELTEDNGSYISPRTIGKIFSPGSEDCPNFRLANLYAVARAMRMPVNIPEDVKREMEEEKRNLSSELRKKNSEIEELVAEITALKKRITYYEGVIHHRGANLNLVVILLSAALIASFVLFATGTIHFAAYCGS